MIWSMICIIALVNIYIANNAVTLLETEIDTIKEQTSKQLQDAETILELEKQKLLKVNS
jgi:predicted Holliday junction resolvase-like endonuclease